MMSMYSKNCAVVQNSDRYHLPIWWQRPICVGIVPVKLFSYNRRWPVWQMICNVSSTVTERMLLQGAKHLPSAVKRPSSDGIDPDMLFSQRYKRSTRYDSKQKSKGRSINAISSTRTNSKRKMHLPRLDMSPISDGMVPSRVLFSSLRWATFETYQVRENINTIAMDRHNTDTYLGSKATQAQLGEYLRSACQPLQNNLYERVLWETS
jgi:hypothetical protein